ncbi:carbonic anhydrase [Lentithecium fluviatile CBS 122367]|uniref:Carbonic anhydrase n=1 Tax=Lentithecium fluviatile CBS 122367 TaxID=1168545 RepID=A0A6G1IZY1_9PLEO|nr:carbonic anhydrase [Lentithecium fluviatile CBS 122367]
MRIPSILSLGALLSPILACPDHSNNKLLLKRAEISDNATAKWAYEASFNWGKLDPAYALCQNGTQQSPIALSLSNGLSLNHVPEFNYPSNVTGNFFNWGYGPAFTVAHDEAKGWEAHPSFTYDNTTVYLKGWHIHAPADHTVAMVRSRAELHLVHVDASGHEAAVLAIRLDPGNRDSSFFSLLPPMIGFNDVTTQVQTNIDLNSLLEAVHMFDEFWTYRGSLTSPPCTEGIRWFMARQICYVGVGQMQGILGASTYSARAEQAVWQHRINE